MNSEILSELRNKLTPRLRSGQAAPKIALEKLAKGEKVPREFLELAAKELDAALRLLGGKVVSGKRSEVRGNPLYKRLKIFSFHSKFSTHTSGSISPSSLK